MMRIRIHDPVSSPAVPGRLRSRAFRGLGAWVVLPALAAVALLAHGGHEGVTPTFRQIELGSERWRVGLGTVPADPLVGDELRIEIKAEDLPADGSPPTRLATADQLTLVVETTTLDLKPAQTDGVFAATWTVESAGPLRVSVELSDGDGASGKVEFPVRARAVSAGWLQPFVLIIILLIVASPGLFLSRDVRRWWDRGSVVRRGLLIGTAVAVVAVLLPVSGAIATALAAAFAPERPTEAVDWIVDVPPGGTHLAEAAAPSRPAAARGGDLDPSQIVARVMAPPDRVADVIVPMPGRVFPVENTHVTVGSRVTKGQTLLKLQPTYIMHDALHLINLRWPILQSVVTTRRRMLETQAELERLRAAVASEAAGSGSVQTAETVATTALQEYEQWNRTLAMHDEQIKDDQPKNELLAAPISGEIATANFAQGQMVYETQPLFTIVDLTTVWVEVRVPEQFASRFRRDELTFSAASMPGQTFAGRLHHAAPAVDPLSRTLSYFYTVANPRRLLRIGMLLNLGQGPSASPDETKSVSVLGRVAAKPELQAQVSAPIWGRVEFIGGALSVGQVVKKGAPLLRTVLELSATERYLMESRKVEVEAAAKLAETRRQQAERDYRRAVTVLKVDPTNPVRRAQVVGAERLHKAAQEEKSLFERQVEVFDIVMKRRDPRITVVQAPIAGTITAVNVTAGQVVETGLFPTLVTIADLTRVWIEADVFESDVPRLIDGVHASFTTDDGVTHELGRPVAILPWLDEQTRRIKAMFEVPNSDGRLRLGMTVQVALDPMGADGK